MTPQGADRITTYGGFVDFDYSLPNRKSLPGGVRARAACGAGPCSKEAGCSWRS